MKINLKRTLIIIIAIVLLVLSVSSIVFFILRATPENVAKRVIKQTFAYKPSQYSYLDISDQAEKIKAMEETACDKYSKKDVTDDFLLQLIATTIPYEYSEIAYNSGKKTACKNIKLDDITPDGNIDEAIYDFTATLKANDAEYELEGTVILIYSDGNWQVNYMVVSSRIEK